MAILQTTMWRTRPGRVQDFMANVTTAKTILQRLGGRVRVVNQIVGSNAPSTIVIVESNDWKAYGELQAKMQADSEWQGFFTKAIGANRDPSADMVGTGLSVEVPIG
jgi:hypothetical protein